MEIVRLRDEKDLLAHTGKGNKTKFAMIPVNNQPVIIEYTEDRHILNRFSEVLVSIGRTRFGQWIDLNEETVIEADTPHPKVPKILISRAFDPSHTTFMKWRNYLSFIYIVQGMSGTRKAKAVMVHDIEAAALGMLHEAANGYSIVFSAALYRGVADFLFEGKYEPGIATFGLRYIMVDTWEEAADKGAASFETITLGGVEVPSLKTTDGKINVFLYF